MRKIIFQMIYAVLIGLSIYSCSELILPKRVGVKGTLNVPIKVGAADLNSTLTTRINEIFAAGKQENTIVYPVDYEGQTVQTFCIYIPIEMTEDLNPGNFLKIIDKQISGTMNVESKEISIQKSIVDGDHIPINRIKLFDGNNNISISLDEIAGYVRSITFGLCQETVDSGIGLNFYFDKIPPGLEMTVTCFEIKNRALSYPPLFSTTKPLEEKKNIKFGNDESSLSLEEINEYQEDERMLYFTMTLQPVNPLQNELDISDLNVGDEIIKGKISVFHVWTEAQIELAKALKASAAIDNEFGKFPANAFDLSGLKKYFNGGFDFNGLEVKIYIDGPDPKLIDYLGAQLLLKAQYDGDTGTDGKKLYHYDLSVNKDPIKMDDYLVKKDKVTFYVSKDLPDNLSGHDDKIDDDTIADIFRTMPDDLSFIFTIEMNDLLTIYPDAFDNIDNSGAIKTTMMIMLPMSLKATGDDDNKTTISFPDMFGDGDLFSRERPEDLFSEADIEYIRMTIGFYDQIFTGGHLFINQNDPPDLFPQGIQLDGKDLVLNFTDDQIKEIEKKLIKPDIKIEFDKGGTINIPKTPGIVSIKFEVKGIINIGEL